MRRHCNASLRNSTGVRIPPSSRLTLPTTPTLQTGSKAGGQLWRINEILRYAFRRIRPKSHQSGRENAPIRKLSREFRQYRVETLMRDPGDLRSGPPRELARLVEVTIAAHRRAH